MNIFILDKNINKAARYHTDKHCVKLILEQAQMLCSALIINPELAKKIKVRAIPYSKTHIHHPCVKWVSKNYANFAYLAALTDALHQEYKHRYAKEHLSYTKLKANGIINNKIIAYGSKLDINDLDAIKVMPEDCRVDSVVESYRNYYRKYKTHLFKWTKRKAPSWIA